MDIDKQIGDLNIRWRKDILKRFIDPTIQVDDDVGKSVASERDIIKTKGFFIGRDGVHVTNKEGKLE